jgi:hypothetical protein
MRARSFVSFQLVSLAGVLLAAAGCDYSGEWLFPGHVDGVPGIDHIDNVVPVDITNRAELDNAIERREIGPTGTAEPGGITLSFVGTGRNVCVWVDPELVYWNQSVADRNPEERYAYPDNVFDDGDLDISVGFAAYYSGTAAHEDDGGRIGDFRLRFEDSLDQEISVAFNECVITTQLQDSGGAAGRGSPEYCTIANTQPGVSYLVLMKTWNTPLDDDRLGYGFVLANGDCDDLIGVAANGDTSHPECVIRGEALDPNDPSRAVPGSEDLEAAYCDDVDDELLPAFCQNEAALIASGQKDCAVDRCFCGDPANTPNPGSF